jgi:predicted negative regulator of RcsB-dependent stress response
VTDSNGDVFVIAVHPLKGWSMAKNDCKSTIGISNKSFDKARAEIKEKNSQKSYHFVSKLFTTNSHAIYN